MADQTAPSACDEGLCPIECPEHVTRLVHEWDGEPCRDSADFEPGRCEHGFAAHEVYP